MTVARVEQSTGLLLLTIWRSAGTVASDRLQERKPVPETRSDLLQGTLEMLVLKTLSLEPMHGWGISLRLRQISGEVFEVQQGSLYPALQRMLRRGWIRSE